MDDSIDQPDHEQDDEMEQVDEGDEVVSSVSIEEEHSEEGQTNGGSDEETDEWRKEVDQWREKLRNVKRHSRGLIDENEKVGSEERVVKFKQYISSHFSS